MKIGLLGKIIVVSTALLLAAGVARPLIQIGQTVPTMAEVTSLPVVIIDPGHPGESNTTAFAAENGPQMLAAHCV